MVTKSVLTYIDGLLREIDDLKNQVSRQNEIIKGMEISILEFKSQMSVTQSMNSGRSD